MHWAARQAVVRISLMCVSQLEASSLPSHRSMLWVCSLHASTSLIKLSWRTWYLLKTRKRKLQKEKRADKTEWQRKQTQICPQYVQWQDSSEHLHGCAATWRLRIEKDFQLHCKDASVSCEKKHSCSTEETQFTRWVTWRAEARTLRSGTAWSQDVGQLTPWHYSCWMF